MFQDTRPAPLGADPGALSEFRLDEAVEIKVLLKALMDRNVTLNLSCSNGVAYSTTLWSVDAAQRKIAFSADLMAPAVQALVEAEEAVAVGYLDQIKVQFDVGERVLVHGNRACVLQASFPQELFRFQRRSSYRVRTLERQAPTASLRHPQLPDMALDLRVLDVSMGGCALFLPLDVPDIEPGVCINAVRLRLDADTEFKASLTVHHVTAIQPQSRGVRLGCELTLKDPSATRSLQRYIDQTQKHRRMLSLD
jgi:c-di-GMP-binding flagellar brake protein YcgR